MTTISTFRGSHFFLSNFFPCRPCLVFTHYGLCGEDPHWYRTVEHAYQASKYPAGGEMRSLIRAVPDAKMARSLGQSCGIRADWDKIKVEVMHWLLLQKFKDAMCEELLKRTKDATLIEGNYWHDQFWGSCTCKKHSAVAGRNELGKLLMRVRHKLQNPSLL